MESLMKRRFAQFMIAAAIAGLGLFDTPAAKADLPIGASMDGIDGKWQAHIGGQFDAMQSLGVNMVRTGMWYGQDPKDLGPLIDQCIAHKIQPMILVEYYMHMGDLKHGKASVYEYWHGLGHDLAQLYGHKILVYSAFNEPDIYLFVDDKGAHFDDPRGIIPVNDYYQAMKGFADGIHSVDKTLKVTPGGFGNPCYHTDYTLAGYGTVLAPLWNDGTLDGIDLHIYGTDVDHWRVSEQGAFDKVKKTLGITRDINCYCTELNTGTKPGDDAKFLTYLWNNLGVVGNGGDDSAPRTGYSMPYTLFALQSKQSYGLAVSLQPSFVPSQRALTIKLVKDLTKGAKLDLLEPHTSGIYTLSAPNKHIWVWQNYLAYSLYSGTSLPLTGIPAKTTSIKVYRYNSTLDSPYRTIPISGQSQIQINDLPENETLMFVGDSGARVATRDIKISVGAPNQSGDESVLSVPASWPYSKSLGFGFASSGNGAGDGSTGSVFLIDVPNGRYKVAVLPSSQNTATNAAASTQLASSNTSSNLSKESFTEKVSSGQLRIDLQKFPTALVQIRSTTN